MVFQNICFLIFVKYKIYFIFIKNNQILALIFFVKRVKLFDN